MSTGLNSLKFLAFMASTAVFLSVIVHSNPARSEEGAAASLVGKFAPVFTHSDQDSWLQSKPLSWGDLNGKVVLAKIWSVGSWSSVHSLPWIREIYHRFKDKGFEVLLIHSPEFAHERDRPALKRKLAEFSLSFPVLLDDDGTYAKTLDVLSRPTFIIVGRTGQVRAVFSGEIIAGSPAAMTIEKAITAALQ